MKKRSILWLIGSGIMAIVGLFFGKKTTLQSNQKKQIQSKWQAVAAIQNPTTSIIEAEKVFVYTLKKLGYTGTFAQQWKKAEQRFGKRQYIWNAHKLRNRIVHEPGTVASQKDATFVKNSYYKVLQQLLS